MNQQTRTSLSTDWTIRSFYPLSLCTFACETMRLFTSSCAQGLKFPVSNIRSEQNTSSFLVANTSRSSGWPIFSNKISERKSNSCCLFSWTLKKYFYFDFWGILVVSKTRVLIPVPHFILVPDFPAIFHVDIPHDVNSFSSNELISNIRNEYVDCVITKRLHRGSTYAW